MTNCWSEGALRTYLDRELPAGDMKLVAAHLGECSSCDTLCTELAGRAARVFALLETLPQPETTVRMRPMPSRAPSRALSRWLWPGAAVALAAGLAIASFTVQKRQELPQVAQVAPNLPAVPVEPVITALPETTPAPTARAAVAKLPVRKRNAAASMDYFLALDDEPIESGVIMRVAVQPGNAQADIVFDPGGRARAIRLVSNKY
jgi:predicted anti-sigma-YlaC factor YlaD